MELVLDPGQQILSRLEEAQPQNPFATAGHARALAAGGASVAVLQADPQDPTCWAQAALHRGRLRTALEVPSFAGVWRTGYCDRLRDLAKRHKISTVELQTFASPDGASPACPGARTQPRSEFIWALPGEGDLMASLSRTHRERARKAMKAGVVVERLATENAMAAVRSLHDQSLDRREARGEHVSRGAFDFGDRLVAHAEAQVFGATHEGVLLAAVLVAVAQRGAYTVYSGNAPEGMKLGAAHWLRVEVAEAMRRDGRLTLNLAGASAEQQGLADFKRRFGAEERSLAHATFDTATGWRKMVARLRRA